MHAHVRLPQVTGTMFSSAKLHHAAVAARKRLESRKNVPGPAPEPDADQSLQVSADDTLALMIDAAIDLDGSAALDRYALEPVVEAEQSSTHIPRCAHDLHVKTNLVVFSIPSISDSLPATI